MQSFYDLLQLNSEQQPDCRCGEAMSLARTAEVRSSMELRTYVCESCGHELKLTVWADLEFAARPAAGL